MDLEHNDRDLGWGQTVSFALSVTLLTVIAFLLIWIKCFLRRYDLKEDSTLHRFGGLYESLIPKKSSIILLEWFIARRLIFVATAYYAMGQLWICFHVLFVASLITLSLLIVKKFYEESSNQAGEIYNELGLLLVQYHLFGFSDLVSESEVRIKLGYSVALITLTIVAFSFIINMTAMFFFVRLYCKTKYAQYKKRKYKIFTQKATKKHPLNLGANPLHATQAGSVSKTESIDYIRNQTVAQDNQQKNSEINPIEQLISELDRDPHSVLEAKNDLLRSLSSLSASSIEIEQPSKQDYTFNFSNQQLQAQNQEEGDLSQHVVQEKRRYGMALQHYLRNRNAIETKQKETDIFRLTEQQSMDIQEFIQLESIDITRQQKYEKPQTEVLYPEASRANIAISSTLNNDSMNHINIPLSGKYGFGIQRSKEEYREIAKTRLRNAISKLENFS